MANLDFLNQFAVGGKQQSSAPKTSTSEKKANNENATIRNFINNFRKMAAVAKDMQASGQQPASNETTSGEPIMTRIVAPSALENTNYTGRARGGIADPTAKYSQQVGVEGGVNPFKQSMDTLTGKVSEYQKAEEAKKAAEAENPDDYVEYTYKPGDTFGQVILDLGIDTNKGLWGSDGDVAYYTKQLREQGIPGMVPIGTKIRLKKRK